MNHWKNNWKWIFDSKDVEGVLYENILHWEEQVNFRPHNFKKLAEQKVSLYSTTRISEI